jgi:hypothetical protein
MKKLLSIVLLSVFFSSTASGQVLVYGVGNGSCGKWVKDRKKIIGRQQPANNGSLALLAVLSLPKNSH